MEILLIIILILAMLKGICELSAIYEGGDVDWPMMWGVVTVMAVTSILILI